jgi:hypothetical protein
MTTLRVYTIHRDPAGDPGRFLVRAWALRRNGPRPTGVVRVAETLDEARRLLPRGLERAPQNPSTDPTLIETWR